MELAINGGKPLRTKKWSKWPIWNDSANSYLEEVMHSGRWSIRGAWMGQEAKEMVFSKKFCEYNGVDYCVLTTSGTMGLMISLEALDISYGDEVIVPALTWIAPITAVLNVGAIPVMVDVEKETTCIDPDSIRKVIGPKTKAIIVIHLHCSVANMDEILKIANEYNLYIIEDCSQAHGAMWEERYVGTMGDVGVFSMNQEKVLTCGEGGAVITNNPEIYDKLCRTKTDGCRFDDSKKIKGEDQLIYDKECMGSNFCISEFQSAILLSQLEKLTEWNEKRRKNANYLDKELGKIQGLVPLEHHIKASKKTYYEYAIRIDNSYFSNKKTDRILQAVSAEIGFCIHQTDVPVYRNDLFSPWTKEKYRYFTNTDRYLKLNFENFTNCEFLFDRLAVFHHHFLLGEREDMDDIIQTFMKVQEHANEL